MGHMIILVLNLCLLVGHIWYDIARDIRYRREKKEIEARICNKPFSEGTKKAIDDWGPWK